MALALKIIDKRPTEPHKHNKVFQTFGKIGVSVKKVHDVKGVFFAITNEHSLETILSEENKITFQNEGFELVPPIEYNSLKTIEVKNLNYMTDSYSDDEIIESIERLNSWAKLECVYKIPTTSKLLKIRFQNQQMVEVALQKPHQCTPPKTSLSGVLRKNYLYVSLPAGIANSMTTGSRTARLRTKPRCTSPLLALAAMPSHQPPGLNE